MHEFYGSRSGDLQAYHDKINKVAPPKGEATVDPAQAVA